MVITRCTPRRASRSSVGEPDVVTTKVSGSRPAATRASRATSSRRGRLGPDGRVDPVTETAGQFGHLRPEAAHDHRRRRRRSQETTRTPDRSRPRLTQRGNRRLDRCPPRDVTVYRATQRRLLGGVWGAGAASGADTQQQPAAADLLQRRRHHCQRAGVAVGDVEHERPDRQLWHHRGERAEDRPELQDVRRSVRRADEVVIEPHAVEARLLGNHGGGAEVLPSPSERVKQQVHLHAADRTGDVPALLGTRRRDYRTQLATPVGLAFGRACIPLGRCFPRRPGDQSSRRGPPRGGARPGDRYAAAASAGGP